MGILQNQWMKAEVKIEKGVSGPFSCCSEQRVFSATSNSGPGARLWPLI